MRQFNFKVKAKHLRDGLKVRGVLCQEFDTSVIAPTKRQAERRLKAALEGLATFKLISTEPMPINVLPGCEADKPYIPESQQKITQRYLTKKRAA